MQSNSKNKLNSSFSKLTVEETFRALVQAMYQKNYEMVQTLQQETPEANKEEVNRLFLLYLDKVALYNQYLLTKALMAVRFYNNLNFELFDLGKVEEGELGFETDFDSLNELENKMAELDKQANGLLDLEIFQETMFMEVLFNQWMKIAIKIATGYAIKTPIQDFEEVKSRLEQIRNNH